MVSEPMGSIECDMSALFRERLVYTFQKNHEMAMTSDPRGLNRMSYFSIETEILQGSNASHQSFKSDWKAI